MDYFTEKFNVYSPICFASSQDKLTERTIYDTIYFKEDAIFHAIDEALKMGITNFVLVADPMDLPGNFTFPIIVEYLKKNGITDFQDNKKKTNNYIRLVSSYKNEETVKNILNQFYEEIK